MELLDRPLDGYDWLTFGAGVILIIAFMAIVLFVMGLPGRIAISRGHPHAEAVKVMGWVGFLAVVPWINAFIWAFQPTTAVDIRRFPKEEKEEVRKEIAKLRGQPVDPSEEEDTDKS